MEKYSKQSIFACACLKTHTTQGMALIKKAIPILKKRLCIVAE
jgi:hypothetical protein